MENCGSRGAAAFLRALLLHSHMMPLCISHPTASPGRNNKVRVFIRSDALFPRTQFVLNASTAGGRWRHAPKTAVSTRIARIARHPLPCRGFHQIRTSVQLKHRPPNERRASSIPLSATADSTRSIDLGPRPVWRPIYYHRGRDAGCRSFSRTNPRHAEVFAAGIDRGTQCAGDQHQNLFASLSSFLDDPASFLSCRVNLEFASSQRSSRGRSSSLHRLRRYPVFAPSDQVLAFVLSNLCLRTAFSRPDTRDMPGARLSHVRHFNVLLGICRMWPLV